MDIALKIAVGVIALMLGFLGINAAIDPAGAASQFGLTSNGIIGLSTLRSDFGGMFVTSAVLLILGLLRGETLWFLAVALLMGVIGLFRGIGFVVDGYDASLLPPFLFEIIFVVALVVAHRQLKVES